MRQFVLLGHEAPTEPGISLDDLPGAGRLDVLCRAVNSALVLSHDLRSDVEIALVIDDTYTISFAGSSLRNLHPDERTIASRIDGALAVAEEAIGHQPVEASPGVFVYRMDTAATLTTIAEDRPVYWLTAAGRPLPDVTVPSEAAFVLSDHRDFTDTDRQLLEETAEQQVSVGPRAVHGNHAITIVHNYLDTAGYTQYH